jgi:hypothetical protein
MESLRKFQNTSKKEFQVAARKQNNTSIYSILPDTKEAETIVS